MIEINLRNIGACIPASFKMLHNHLPAVKVFCLHICSCARGTRSGNIDRKGRYVLLLAMDWRIPMRLRDEHALIARLPLLFCPGSFRSWRSHADSSASEKQNPDHRRPWYLGSRIALLLSSLRLHV